MSILAVISALVLTGSLPTDGAPDGPAVQPHDVEATLEGDGWTVVHRAAGDDHRSLSIGARHVGGLSVVHTFGDCSTDGCRHWRQSTPLDALSAVPVAATPTALAASARAGRHLRVIEDDRGRASLEQRAVPAACADGCERQRIAAFARDVHAAVDNARSGLTAPTVAHHGGWQATATTAAVPLHHREVAALVAATERAVGQTKTPAAPAGSGAPRASGTTTFPALLPHGQ